MRSRNRPRFRMLLGVLVAAAGACLALPGVAGAQAPAQDSVVGGLSPGIFEFFNVDVRSGPAGEAPTGTLTYFAGTPTNNVEFASSTISCLAVTGNIAVVGATGVRRTVRVGPDGFVVTEENTGFVAIITDNGPAEPPPPTGPLPSSDTVEFEFVATPDCAAPPTNARMLTGPGGLFGGLTVVDAQSPLPTSKDQCKNGGWRNFPGIKSQGQCVALVERHPQP
jgi:hypothetical protein